MSDAAILDDLRRRVDDSPFHRGFGLTVEDAAAGMVRLGWSAKEEHLNLQGLVHGGVLATLADVAMGLAVRTAIEPGRRHVTIELGVHYLRPASPGDVARRRSRGARRATRSPSPKADVLDGSERLSGERRRGTYRS